MNKDRDLLQKIIEQQKKIKSQQVVQPTAQTVPEEKKFKYNPPENKPKT